MHARAQDTQYSSRDKQRRIQKSFLGNTTEDFVSFVWNEATEWIRFLYVLSDGKVSSSQMEVLVGEITKEAQCLIKVRYIYYRLGDKVLVWFTNKTPTLPTYTKKHLCWENEHLRSPNHFLPFLRSRAFKVEMAGALSLIDLPVVQRRLLLLTVLWISIDWPSLAF